MSDQSLSLQFGVADPAFLESLASEAQRGGWPSMAAMVTGYLVAVAKLMRRVCAPRPNAVGPFGTPAAPFVIVRHPDGTRSVDDVQGKTPEAQARILEALARGEVLQLHVGVVP